ncbi:UvrD-helicase domain-containing protein [Bradyrhizobium erythrophlei]|uniref:DNA 3'-5' helicase n=1 Tax=Bradyrhizobium erythrophlei TaxID=1437360 RepID=A0A1H4XI03_9BRAD|nr:UvrD-helicase domain-containing protein [Bradyrhizobium erythrophlei]SED04354.1 UvrD/REP helicase N-terminal domain-containing protein [Bradyrhizobium erythrophlei]
MSRQYLSWSIAQLEDEFERAQDSGDRAAIERVVSELGFRTTPKARSLRQAVQRFMGAAARPGGEQRGAAKPPPTAKSGPTQKPPHNTNGKPARKPTAEQQQAIDQFQHGGSVKINAYAGTGKTSTLEFLAQSTSRRGQYIAFNRDIVRDAKEKFPNTVNCSTSHGLAFKATPSAYRNNSDKMTKRVNANQLAEMLNLRRWEVDGRHVLQPRSQGYLILDTLRRYMQSADAELAAHHVTRHGSLLAAPEATMQAVTEFALHGAKHVWGRMRAETDPMPLGHDGYLKLWALSNPKIAADFILLDEAQDTNPIVLDVLRKQSAQMIYVGDKYQQIYEWRGAVNAMGKIETQGETYLTTSFRFGPAIAEWASKLLDLLGEKRPLRGNVAVKSRVGRVEPRTILARTNASTIAAIIECLDEGKKPHLVGGADELMEMLRGVQDLKEGKQSTVPDFFGFDKWQQVVEFTKSGEGDHLLSFVNLVEGRGERQLMWALNRTVDEERSDLTISTAHKAKGREWSTVRLTDDFLRSRPGKPANGPDPAEVRLFYVALTRAKEAVEVPQNILSLIR